MVVTYEEAKKLVLPAFGMDPYFPKENGAECSEEHVRHMLQEVWPNLATYRKVLVAQRPMSTYTALGMFAVGDRDLEHLGAGHIFYIGYPGTGKTLLAKVPQRVVGGTAARVQGTPDLLPADITGNRIIDFDENGKRYFRLIKGPAFSQIQLYDEAFRFAERALSAILEVMGEGTVTIAGETHEVSPFVILTANPVDVERAHQLLAALMDRIMFQIVGEDFTAEVFTAINRRTRDFYSLELKQACTMDKVFKARQFFHETIFVSPRVDTFMGYFCEHINNSHRFEFIQKLEEELKGRVIVKGISGRGSIHLEGAARALAAFRYREYVTFDDYHKILLPILRHRTIFSPGVLSYLKEVRKHRDTLQTKDWILKELIRAAWSRCDNGR